MSIIINFHDRQRHTPPPRQTGDGRSDLSETTQRIAAKLQLIEDTHPEVGFASCVESLVGHGLKGLGLQYAGDAERRR